VFVYQENIYAVLESIWNHRGCRRIRLQWQRYVITHESERHDHNERRLAGQRTGRSFHQ
jgi:hypothetical protein